MSTEISELYAENLSRVQALKLPTLKLVARALSIAQSGRKADVQDRVRKFIQIGKDTNNKPRLLAIAQIIRDAAYGNIDTSYEILYNEFGGRQGPSQINSSQGSAGGSRSHVFPWLFFRESPFFVLKKLVTQDAGYCSRAPDGRGTCKLSFRLSDSDYSLLKTSKHHKLYLLCGVYDRSKQNDALIEFPQPLEIHFNQIQIKDNVKGIKNKPGTAKPANLTPYIHGNGRMNELTMVYAFTEVDHLIFCYMVEEIPASKVLLKVLENPHLPSQSTLKEFNREEQDEDDIQEMSTRLSLKCPLSFARMKYPTKSIYCTHLGCFDALSFLHLQEQTPNWACPLCYKKVKVKELALNDYVLDILKKTPEEVEVVEIGLDGSWTPIFEEDDGNGSDSPKAQDSVAEESKHSPVKKTPNSPVVISLDSDDEDADFTLIGDTTTKQPSRSESAVPAISTHSTPIIPSSSTPVTTSNSTPVVTSNTISATPSNITPQPYVPLPQTLPPAYPNQTTPILQSQSASSALPSQNIEQNNESNQQHSNIAVPLPTQQISSAVDNQHIENGPRNHNSYNIPDISQSSLFKNLAPAATNPVFKPYIPLPIMDNATRSATSSPGSIVSYQGQSPNNVDTSSAHIRPSYSPQEVPQQSPPQAQSASLTPVPSFPSVHSNAMTASPSLSSVPVYPQHYQTQYSALPQNQPQQHVNQSRSSRPLPPVFPRHTSSHHNTASTGIPGQPPYAQTTSPQVSSAQTPGVQTTSTKPSMASNSQFQHGSAQAQPQKDNSGASNNPLSHASGSVQQPFNAQGALPLFGTFEEEQRELQKLRQMMSINLAPSSSSPPLQASRNEQEPVTSRLPPISSEPVQQRRTTSNPNITNAQHSLQAKLNAHPQNSQLFRANTVNLPTLKNTPAMSRIQGLQKSIQNSTGSNGSASEPRHIQAPDISGSSLFGNFAKPSTPAAAPVPAAAAAAPRGPPVPPAHSITSSNSNIPDWRNTTLRVESDLSSPAESNSDVHLDLPELPTPTKDLLQGPPKIQKATTPNTQNGLLNISADISALGKISTGNSTPPVGPENRKRMISADSSSQQASKKHATLSDDEDDTPLLFR